MESATCWDRNCEQGCARALISLARAVAIGSPGHVAEHPPHPVEKSQTTAAAQMIGREQIRLFAAAGLSIWRGEWGTRHTSIFA